MRAEHWTAKIQGVGLEAWIAKDDEGRVRAIKATLGPTGNPLGAALDLVCAAATVSLSRGVPLAAVTKQWRGQRFEPAGETGDPLAPECSSVVDYLAAAIERRAG